MIFYGLYINLKLLNKNKQKAKFRLFRQIIFRFLLKNGVLLFPLKLLRRKREEKK